MTSVHLGFDMGIRNLAYCLVRHITAETWEIVAWDNIDLLEGGASAQDAKKCVACTGSAKWIYTDGKKWCQGCATGVRRKKTVTEKPTVGALPCAVNVKELKALATTQGVDTKGMKKEDLVTWASGRYLMPWKAVKAMDTSLSVIRKAMDTWLTTVLPTFVQASLIRLENQPVMKGPTMKTVQMILFTLLAHRLEKEHGWTGRIEFVHAGTKSKGSVPVVADLSGATVTEGAAYRARKKTAESDVVDLLTKGAMTTWLTFFEGRSKKSDLADALLMAVRH